MAARCASRVVIVLVSLLMLGVGARGEQEAVPLAEHPRPDFQRQEWINLNGAWDFRFDAEDAGEKKRWFAGGEDFPEKIRVPFSWGSPLSEIEDQADTGWYARSIRVPEDWDGKRVFLVIGASDWHTTAWLDGHRLGTHEGGYTPFELELSPHVRPGREQRLVIRVDDAPRPFKLEGKQGYGPARGIWQTTYLEARGSVPIKALYFTPDIRRERVSVRVALLEPASRPLTLDLRFTNGDRSPAPVQQTIPAGSENTSFEVKLSSPRLWSLDDPFLYEVEASLSADGQAEDRVETYFGMREVGVVDLPGSGHPYVMLNGEPVYLQLALDQAYHPDGYYTFPSDQFMRDEILRAKRLGLNGIRIHVKIGIPRKLYWADRLGLLVMADVPNSWGEPTPEMRQETEHALRGMIQRDYNHPSIFSWVIFNETWGLRHDKEYRKDTQEWVASMYRLAKSLDSSRLVEDNSPNQEDHVVTDLNTWHKYLSGYGWKEHLDDISDKTFEGSDWNFVEDKKQDRAPLLNSEFGNVWGYEGSTGDVDWSWDYHIMVNEFRRHPKVAGWLYTEFHDVINEWNGYYRFDRSEKLTGLAELVEGMSLADLHAPLYVAPGGELCRTAAPGEEVEIPLWLSFMTGDGDTLTLRTQIYGWNDLGQKKDYGGSSRSIDFRPWRSEAISPLRVRMPQESSLVLVALSLEDASGQVVHRNFTTFLVEGETSDAQIQKRDGKRLRLLRFAPDSFARAAWSLKSWPVLDGLKMNGAGAGYFEYRLPWPEGVKVQDVAQASFLAELSAKQLFSKDRDAEEGIEGNFMLGKGTHDPSLNRNAYPMTDEVRFPSVVRVRVNGEVIGTHYLPDDPADHRGILSWFSQKRDGYLREAGSYGYLTAMSLPASILQRAATEKEIVIRLEVDEAIPGGVAVYGKRFGRYPLDPTITFVLK